MSRPYVPTIEPPKPENISSGYRPYRGRRAAGRLANVLAGGSTNPGPRVYCIIGKLPIKILTLISLARPWPARMRSSMPRVQPRFRRQGLVPACRQHAGSVARCDGRLGPDAREAGRRRRRAADDRDVLNLRAEKMSGARTDRPELAKLLKRLDAGDVLLVTRLDRLARSTRDLLNILDAVGKAGAAFKSLGDAWADTTTPHGRLMLTVLGGLAEFE